MNRSLLNILYCCEEKWNITNNEGQLSVGLIYVEYVGKIPY